jgi:hypothetical protein
MFLTKKKPTTVSATIEDEEIDPIYDEELETIEYLRSLDKKDYDKIIKKAEIYREADEAVAKLDGKKAAKKAQELLENEYTE